MQKLWYNYILYPLSLYLLMESLLYISVSLLLCLVLGSKVLAARRRGHQPMTTFQNGELLVYACMVFTFMSIPVKHMGHSTTLLVPPSPQSEYFTTWSTTQSTVKEVVLGIKTEKEEKAPVVQIDSSELGEKLGKEVFHYLKAQLD